MAKGTKTGKEPTYTEASTRLEAILLEIEEGRVDIAELSGLVTEAAELVALCREKIHAAEVQVKTITEQLEREAPSASEPGAERQDPEGEEPPF